MSPASETLASIYREVTSLTPKYPEFIGFDDYESTFSGLPPLEPVPPEVKRFRSINEQRQWREAIVLRFQDQLGSINSPDHRSDLPYFLCCLSTQPLVAYANTYGNQYSLQAEVTTAVLMARIVHDAYASLFPNGRITSEIDPEDIGDAIRRLSRGVEEHLSGNMQEVFKEQVARLSERHSLMHQIQSGGNSTQGAAASTLTVIVHGTWAADTDWWRDPRGMGAMPIDNLWDYLTSSGVTGLVSRADEFTWSGKNSDAARLVGANQFTAWWQRLGKPGLDVVAHSHGGNVVMRAQAIEPELRVRNLILLGTPARYECPPCSRQTRRQYNVYSDNDWIQVVGSKGGA